MRQAEPIEARGGRRSMVRSTDGTPIAWFTTGKGPAVVLVHGGGGDHTRWGPLLSHLEAHVTVHAMDRRGRGASGDQPDHRLEREFEDVAAVIDAVAATSGNRVAVYGHSYGGICAFGAAGLTTNIDRLVLYEGWPPVHPEEFMPPPGRRQRIDELLAVDEREAALETVLRDVARVSDEEIERYREQPSWAARLEAVGSFAREEQAFATHPFDVEVAAKTTVPTLLLAGTRSPDWYPEAATVAAALPDARLIELPGQGHAADIVAPALIADLTHDNNRVRSIASQILCNLAKSDPEQRIVDDLPHLIEVTKDERFVTARHCLQSLWKVGVAGDEQREAYRRALTQRFADCRSEKNWSLIRSDIAESLRRVYDQTGDEALRGTAERLIESEDDDKYRRKYAKTWKL